MPENEIVDIVLDAAFDIHKKLGPGLFESVYEAILAHELEKEYGLMIERQAAIPVMWKDVKLDLGFKADIIVENKVIVELKSIEALAAVHPKQVLTYLRLTGLKLGLLINFNEALLKNGIKRIANNL
jgi:GxxExxY protein